MRFVLHIQKGKRSLYFLKLFKRRFTLKRFSLFAVFLMFFAVTAYAFPTINIEVHDGVAVAQSSSLLDVSAKTAAVESYSQYQYILSSRVINEHGFCSFHSHIVLFINHAKNYSRQFGGTPIFIEPVLNSKHKNHTEAYFLKRERINPDSFLS